MKKRLLIVLSSFASIVIMVFVAFCIYTNYFYAKSVDLSYGDVFPKINIYNYNGVKTDFSKFTSKYKVIFYLSNHCQACLNDLEAINRIMKLYNSNDFEFIILWEGAVSENGVNKSAIDTEKNYSLKNQVKLSALTPKTSTEWDGCCSR